jgi:predicted MFS family arabinose efflux permease
MSTLAVVDAEEEGARLSRRLNHRLLALTLLLLLIGAATFSYTALRLFEADLRPALDRKGQLLAETLARDLERAVTLGVPFDQLVGVPAALDALRSGHEEVSYIAVADPRHVVRHVVGVDAKGLQPLLGLRGTEMTVAMGDSLDSEATIDVEGQRLGSVHVGVRQSYARQAQTDVLYDVLVVFLVSLLVTFELLLVLVTLGVAQPLRQVASLLARVLAGDLSPVPLATARDQVGRLLVHLQEQLNGLSQRFDALAAKAAGSAGAGAAWQKLRDDIAMRLQPRKAADGAPVRANLAVVRAPLFLFMFAEELSRSWFPLYVRQIYEPIPGVDEALVIGLPISLFMLVVAIFTPMAGGIIERFGTRRVMVIGTAPAVIGFIGAAFAVSIYDLIAWRCLSALSYAIIFIGSQGFIARNTDPANRAQGMAVFVVAVITAGLCGMSVGGILASQLGYRETFLVSAVLAVGAAAFMVGALPADAPAGGTVTKRQKATAADWRQLLSNPRFAALVAFAAVPTKIVLTGYLYYLVPLYLNELGAGGSLTGRVMMAYGLLIVAFGPWMARVADRLGKHGLFVALGGLLGGGGALLVGLQPPAVDPVLVVLAGVALLGLGHALNNATQLAMVPTVAPEACARLGNATVIGVYRLLERAGTVAGPMIAATFAATLGLGAAMAALGGLILASAVLFVIVMWLVGDKPAAATKSEGVRA